MGSGVSGPDDGLLPGQRRWCSGCRGSGRLCGAPDGAWRWENWGKGQREREEIKNEKRKKLTKRGLESKRKGGKMRRGRKETRERKGKKHKEKGGKLENIFCCVEIRNQEESLILQHMTNENESEFIKTEGTVIRCFICSPHNQKKNEAG